MKSATFIKLSTLLLAVLLANSVMAGPGKGKGQGNGGGDDGGGSGETTAYTAESLDLSLAQQVIDAKDEIRDLADQISNRLVERLIAEDPHRTSTYRVESQLVDHYQRIYYFAKRIAKRLAEDSVVEDLQEPALAT